MFINYFRRLVEVAASRLALRGKNNNAGGNGEPIFLIPHFNSAEFLAATLDAVKRYHPRSRIIVTDATSVWTEYLAAKKTCREHGAEMHPRLPNYRHTGQLNYLLRQAARDKTGSGKAVFLDQDCILFAPLSPLLELLNENVLLIGPRDSMVLNNPNLGRKYPQLVGRELRQYHDYIHASLMITDAAKIRGLFGDNPFTWTKELGDQPLEKYYGLCRRLLMTRPQAMLPLESAHSAYGLGMVYLYEGRPLAYHNWYSGRIHGQKGEMDALDIGWLREEMDRFLSDYRSESLHLDLQ